MDVSSIRGAAIPTIPSVPTKGAEANKAASLGEKKTDDAVKISLESNSNSKAAIPTSPPPVEVGGSLKISA